MKIGQLSDSHIAAGSPVAPKASSFSSAGSESVSTRGVQSSVASVTRSAGRAVGDASGDVDNAKVERMRAAIGNGTFTVNPEAIADKLLSNAQEMLNRMKN